MNNPEHQHRVKTNWIRNQQPQGKKYMGWSGCQGHILTAHRANHTWECVHQNESSSRSVRLHMESPSHSGLPSPEEIRAHKRGSKAAKSCSDGHGLQNMSCKKLKEPGLFCWTKRRSREDLTAPYYHLKESKSRELIILQ